MSSTRDTDAKTQRFFDVRTIDRNVKKGLVTRKDYEKYLKSLPDAAEKVAPIEEHPSEVGSGENHRSISAHAAPAGTGDDIGDDDDDDVTDGVGGEPPPGQV